jgi:acyl-coenzyme A thioesterase PaaI-like protein
VVPDLAKLQAVVTAKEAEGKISVVVQLKSGAAQIVDIWKDGRSAPVAEVTVRDADGRVVASKRGTLYDFGFT